MYNANKLSEKWDFPPKWWLRAELLILYSSSLSQVKDHLITRCRLLEDSYAVSQSLQAVRG